MYLHIAKEKYTFFQAKTKRPIDAKPSLTSSPPSNSTLNHFTYQPLLSHVYIFDIYSSTIAQTLHTTPYRPFDMDASV